MTTVEAPPQAPEASALKPPLLVKLAFSLGQAGQSGGFDAAVAFIFFYYSAVLGLSGALVGAALAVGLAADAAVDPVIGSWSDSLKSRLGRRLPVMMLATPMVALSVGLLFSPPSGLDQLALFGWLAVMSVASRSAISLFQVPYVALGAEMATDYGGRTSLVMYRATAGIITAVAVTAVGYSVFFADGGLQKPDGYPGFGWSVAGLLLVCLTICCLGVWRYAAGLPQPEPVRSALWKRLPGEVAEIFRNRSFRILFFSAVILFTAMGLNASLNNHAFVFVWRIKSELIQFIGYAYLLGMLMGIAAAPTLQKFMEKKYVVILGFGLLIANWIIVQGSMLAGLYLPLGDAALLPMQLNSGMAGIGIGLVSVAYPSMMADAADEHEMLFGRRREGLYFAGLGFGQKAASGIGVMLAGLALDLVRFPKGIAQAAGAGLAPEMQARLVMIWGPVAAVIAVVALVIFVSYNISRVRHDQIAAALGRGETAPDPITD